MNKTCANCGSPQGPFFATQLFDDPAVWACKNTKNAQDRISECVKRRETADNKKYQEQLHPYS